MNDSVQLLAQIICMTLGAFLAKNHLTLTSADAQGIAGALLALAGIVWKYYHWYATPGAAPQNVSITKGNGLGPNVPLFAALLVGLLAFTGCTSAPVVGHVYSISDTCFGLDVQTTSSPNTTPRLRLGFVRSVNFIEPVVTNAPVSVPDVANNFGLQNGTSGATINFDVSESVASGHYQTGAGTNPISSQPIVPK